MVIGNVKFRSPSLPSTSISSETTKPGAVGQGQAGFKELEGALKELSKNPILRSLLGESGFDGVKGKGQAHKGHHGHKADKADKADKAGGKDSAASSQDGIKQLVDGLKKFVQLLEQMLGKKNETQDGTQSADGAGKTGSTGGSEGASGSSGAPSTGGSEGASSTPSTGSTDGAQAAGGADGAQAADGAEASEDANKDPLSQLMDTLKKIITQLEQLMASLSKQNQPSNTGIVPQGATAGSTTGNTGIVPPSVTEV